MFFILSKLFWLFISPVNLALVLLAMGGCLLWRRPRRARPFLLTVISIIICISLLPIGELMLQDLEDRYQVPALPVKVDGIILLGGFIDTARSVELHATQLNAAADRLTAFMTLSHHYPKARLVFSGGAGDPLYPDIKEGDWFLKLWQDLGQTDKNLWVEKQSRNTFENAVLSKEMVRPQPSETWLLVTSAAHMPRAVAIFHNLDWPVVAYPCDYEADGDPLFTLNINVLRNWQKFNAAVKEYIGLAVYHWTGKA